ncbi:ATP-binding cassette domain-containing protein [Bacillus circulans]|uniref:Aliphatic sulfonate ABC transporter ATP-binding protein n=1 Tax=Niallia circulans TaxID=1397 RepID=A0AA91TQ03_NIACI|nr:ATP-binding cassette domain-containing protein [Niallia circulans]NRG25621.1 ATP-binding cassette domain-containing protein [Niallia circulans]PAD81917.1 aliphatic sulfonate ABC transporter ATP-binding protein [Niallia circulans]
MSKEKIYLEIKNLEKSYNETKVLKSLNLKINQGEFLAIVGKSGCGKSTLLRLLSGLEKPTKGEILIDGKPLNSLNREACMMFQDGRLLPWKCVLDNVKLGVKGIRREEAIQVLRDVGLEDKKDEWPANLSGGQKQRVALARSLMHKPRLLLLDEPLGALDALTRLEMQSMIENIQMTHGFTSLLVTHDVEEAVALADRVIVLQDGIIAQDIPITLEKSRQRNHAAFSSLVNDILKKILHPTDEKSHRMIEEERNLALKTIPKLN